jgi:hypothetical protein
MAAAVAALGAPAARAEPTLLLTDDPKPPTESRWDYVPLRPNVEQTFYLWVHNPDKKDARVVVALVDAEGRDVRGMRTKPLTVKPDATERVVFEATPPTTTPAAPPAAAGQPAPAVPPGTELKKGPPFNYNLVLLDADTNKQLGKFAVQLLRPQDYIQEPKGYFIGATGQLQITVKAEDATKFGGPPARVELVLPPDRIPGLRTDVAREGSYERELTVPNDSVVLTADNLQFDPNRPPEKENGLVYLTVDGCPRAYTFLATFRPRGRSDLRLEKNPVVGLQYAHYAPPAPKYHVGLEVDNAPKGADVVVSLRRDRSREPARDEVLTLPGARQQRIFVRPNNPDDGGLIFNTVVRDWDATPISAGMYGEHDIRVNLYDKEEKRAVPFFEPDDLLTQGARLHPALTRSVVFDSTPPDIKALGVVLTHKVQGKLVDFVATKDTPKADNGLPVGAPLRIVATADDPESHISRVVFFLGEPTKELKIPDAAVREEGKPDKGSNTTWRAELPAPTAKEGVLLVSAEVTNGAGITRFGTVEIRLLPPTPAAAAGAVKPSIEGTVIDAGGRLQPRQKVNLVDTQNVTRDTVETDRDGVYLFRDVAPGSYRVTASKTGNNSYGETAVQVLEGDKKTGVVVRLRAR